MKNLAFKPNAIMSDWTGGIGQRFFLVKAHYDEQVNRMVLDFQEGYGYCKVEITEEEYNSFKGEAFFSDYRNNCFFQLKEENELDENNNLEENNNVLVETRTNELSWLTHKGCYKGEYSNEAWERLEAILPEDVRQDNEEFPFGELSWFDIMVDEYGNEYAVFGEDNIYTDSIAYYIEYKQL